jgi:TonB family protein
MKLKSYAIVLGLTIVLLISVQIISASKSASVLTDEPPVIMAVAPNYPALIDAKGAKGDVLVQVKVNADGSVSSAKAISGHPVLRPSSEEAAKRWRFAPSSDAASQRNIILTFTFTPMPKRTTLGDLTPVFYPPYRIEVRKVDEILIAIGGITTH